MRVLPLLVCSLIAFAAVSVSAQNGAVNVNFASMFSGMTAVTSASSNGAAAGFQGIQPTNGDAQLNDVLSQALHDLLASGFVDGLRREYNWDDSPITADANACVRPSATVLPYQSSAVNGTLRTILEKGEIVFGLVTPMRDHIADYQFQELNVNGEITYRGFEGSLAVALATKIGAMFFTQVKARVIVLPQTDLPANWNGIKTALNTKQVDALLTTHRSLDREMDVHFTCPIYTTDYVYVFGPYGAKNMSISESTTLDDLMAMGSSLKVGNLIGSYDHLERMWTLPNAVSVPMNGETWNQQVLDFTTGTGAFGEVAHVLVAYYHDVYPHDVRGFPHASFMRQLVINGKLKATNAITTGRSLGGLALATRLPRK